MVVSGKRKAGGGGGSHCKTKLSLFTQNTVILFESGRRQGERGREEVLAVGRPLFCSEGK